MGKALQKPNDEGTVAMDAMGFKFKLHGIVWLCREGWQREALTNEGKMYAAHRHDAMLRASMERNYHVVTRERCRCPAHALLHECGHSRAYAEALSKAGELLEQWAALQEVNDD